MLRLTDQHKLLRLFKKRGVEIVDAQIRIDPLFGEKTQFAVHQTGKTVHPLNSVVSILAAQEDIAADLVHLGTGRNQHLDHPFATDLLLVWKQ